MSSTDAPPDRKQDLRDLKIIDGVIQSFDKEHPIQRILKDDVPTGAFDAGALAEYHYNNIKYTGVVDTKHRTIVGRDVDGILMFRRLLVIRLSIAQFQYDDRSVQVFKWMTNYQYDGNDWCNDWCVLRRENVLPKMTYLQQLCDQLGQGFTFSFLHSCARERIEIHVYNQDHVCVLKFTFGYGVLKEVEETLEWDADIAF